MRNAPLNILPTVLNHTVTLNARQGVRVNQAMQSTSKHLFELNARCVYVSTCDVRALFSSNFPIFIVYQLPKNIHENPLNIKRCFLCGH